MSKKVDEPKVIKIRNRLKSKVGRDPNDRSQGFLDPKAIDKADSLIEALCAECPKAIAGHLEKLLAFWLKMRDMENCKERDELAIKIFTHAHEIKDIGSMCGYVLIAYFAESLRDYIDQTEFNMKAQRIIIQAHIDAMLVVQKDEIKDDAGPLAEELKKMVKIAIDKYK